jgi:hypothetical protein
VSVDGTVGATADIPRDDEGATATFVTRTSDALFAWNPFGAQLVRYDLGTGQVTEARGRPATSDAPADVLASLGRRVGRWIAPSALAKVALQPAIVASPDGSRIFALGVGGQDGLGGSTGVFVFDAASLDVLGTWAPLADIASIAVSGDGRYVYAAAQGGVAADGSEAPGRGASITVYDTVDGSVRLVAGRLGTADLWLAEATVR